MPPPLPPKPLGFYLTQKPVAVPTPTIDVECFLDLVCPFSGRMLATLLDGVLPLIENDEAKNSAISIKIHHVVQPWHPQSTLVHEAALAVQKVFDTDGNDDVDVRTKHSKYLRWICQQFSGDEKKFSDADTWNKTRSEIYEDLLSGLSWDCDDGDDSSFSSSAIRDKARTLLIPTEGDLVGNCGNGVTQEVKWACKHHRARGVHVTPTVFVNGIEAVQVSSGWKSDDWMEFFGKWDL